jgi:hypothetical protein
VKLVATKTIKIKQPKLPPCPSLVEVRADMRAMNRELREARAKYWLAVWQRGEQLTGNAMLLFILKAGRRMKSAGLYSDGYHDADCVYSGVRFFFRQECSSGSWGDRSYNAWHRWRKHKGVEEYFRTAIAKLKVA